MPRRGSPYGRSHQLRRLALLAARLPCELRLVCDGAPATSPEHDPPIRLHAHVEGSGCCREIPACLPCQHHQGGLIRVGRYRCAPAPSRAWS